MNDHLTGTDLSSFLDGQMDSEKASAFHGHVLMCARCRHDVESFRSLQLRLAKLPTRTAPPQLINKLKKTFDHAPLQERIRDWFALPWAWRPVGAAALGALLFGLWMAFQQKVSDDYVDLGPLIAAHTRYEAESLIPPADITRSQYSSKLALYYDGKN